MMIRKKKKTISVKSIIIVLLLLTTIILACGFSYISGKYKELSQEKTVFDVTFIDLKQKTPIRGGSESPIGLSSLSNDGKTLNFNATLFNNYDELYFTCRLVNNSTIPAKVITLIQNPNYSGDSSLRNEIEPIEIEYDNIYNKVLLPGEKIDLDIKITYNNEGQTSALSKTVSFSISVIANGV